jgi:hypothetical protein
VAARNFELFKLSGVNMRDDILDNRYQGVEKPRKNSLIPFKKPRNGELTVEEKGVKYPRQSRGLEFVSRSKRFLLVDIPSYPFSSSRFGPLPYPA